MKTLLQRPWVSIWACGLVAVSAGQSLAVELLTNGNLEASVAPPGWIVEQTVTGLPGATVNASEQISFASEPNDPGGLGIFLRPFAGNQGSYDGQNRAINYVLKQTVAVAASAAGKTWTLTGNSYFGGDADEFTNDGYSGGVTMLDELSPSGIVPSPTDTTFEMAFLDVGGNVLGAPTMLDLRAEQMNDATWRPHMLSAVAPAGTRQIRVTAAATNMVANTGFQDAYLDNFTLMRSDLAGTNFLSNGNLNAVGPPSGYEIVETPAGRDTIGFRDFANHTPDGQQGLWLRAFEGGDGVMSQTVPGVAGGMYSFSAWSKWEIGYSGGLGDPSVDTFIRMEFLDGTNNVIGSPQTLDLVTAGQMNDGEWRQYSLNGTSPAGTQSVRVSVGATGMFDSLTNPQSAFFDDLSLDVVVAGVPGDYNNNGTVDAADYVLWRNGGPLQNEVSTPGATTAEDYTAWRARFGNTAAAGAGALAAAAVPEPAAGVLAMLALLGGFGIGRGRRTSA